MACFLILAHGGLLVGLTYRVPATTDEENYIFAGRALVDGWSWDTPQERLHGPLALVANQTWISRDDLENRRDALDRARLGMLPFAVLLLLAIGGWAWEAWGWRGGLGALFLAAFEPLLLGYGALVAVDVSLAATATWTFWLLWRWLKRPTAVRLLAWSASLGLCLATKYLALLLASCVPLIVMTAVFLGAETRPPRRRGARHELPHRLAWGALLLAAAAVVSLLFLHAAYLFRAPCYDPVRDGETTSMVLRAVQGLPLVGRLLELLPAPLVLGADFQASVTRAFRGSFMDHLAPNWEYYLAALATKLRLPVLPLALFGFLGWRRASRPAMWLVLCSALPAALLLAYLSFFNTFQAGVRYALPVVPLLLVWAGGAAGAPWWRDRRLRLVAWAGGAWLLMATAASWPHYLGYFNELAGGSGGCYRIFCDTNCDWGQNREEGRLALQKRYAHLQVLDGRDGPRFGTLAIYVWSFQFRDPERPGRTYHWIRRFDPIDHYSSAWYVFEITPPDFEEAARAGDHRAARDLALAWIWEDDLVRARAALALADEGEATDVLRDLIDLLESLEPSTTINPRARRVLGILRRMGRFDMCCRIVERYLGNADLETKTRILFLSSEFEPAIALLRAADRERPLTPRQALRLATMLHMIDPGSLEAYQVLLDHPVPKPGDRIEARYWKVRGIIERAAEDRNRLIEHAR